MELQESTITAVLAGTYDVKAAAAAYAKEHELEEKQRALGAELGANIEKKQWAEAEAVLDKAEKIVPAESRPVLNLRRFQIRLMAKDYKSAYKLAREVTQGDNMPPQLLDQYAWIISRQEGVEERDLDLAETIARKADTQTKGAEPAVLDTLARVLFMQGKKEIAVTTMEKAVSLSKDPQKTKLQATLDSYRAGKVPESK